MASVTTDLLVGSYPSLPSQTMSVTSSATTEAVVIAAGSRYLYDGGSALDLLLALATAINSHSVVSGCTVVIQRDLRVRIGANQNFTLTWPADGVLRGLLGFTGNLSPVANTFTATNISPLLWSAGRPAICEARLGTDGIPVHDTAIGQAAPGIVRATSHNSYRRNTLSWRYVQNARVWTTSEAGGEFFTFFREVLRQVRRFKVHRNVTEDLASTTAITLGSPLPSTGAYVYAPPSRPVEMPWGREFPTVESLHPITCPVVQSPEY